MHSIERYGIVALLFLIVTVGAVLLWDSDKKKDKKDAHPALVSSLPVETRTPPAAAPSTLSLASQESARPEARLTLLADAQPGPLQRNPPAPELDSSALEAFDEGLEPAGAPLGNGARVPSGAVELPAFEAAPASDEPAPPAVKANDAARQYVVRSGDTLSEIAQHELGSAKRWKELVAANPGLDPSKLRVGKKLAIPGGAAASGSRSPGTTLASATPPKASTPPKAKAATPPATGPATWKVGRGESLWIIAQRSLGDGKRWKEIAALNPGLNPDRLVQGAVLKLPAGSKASAGAPAKVAKAPTTPPAAKKGSETLVASAPRTGTATSRGGKVK